MTLLSVNDLTVTLGRRAVIDRLSLPEISSGITALVGPNGAGKSTLLRAIAGLVPSTGTLRWGGIDLQAASRAERAAALTYMPQHLTGTSRLRVLETLVSTLMVGPGRRSSMEARARAVAVLDRLAIRPLAMASLDTLSGGQRQMVGLAQAIIRDPALLLLDEPTSALDLRHQARVMAVARSLADAGTTVLIVLHDLALAARWADRVLVLDGGHLRGAGPPAEAITPALLAAVYGVEGRVETCSRGGLQVMVDAIVEPGEGE